MKDSPDKPENATLKADEPHSFYLGKDDECEEVYFDPQHFYEFICGTKKAGRLALEYNNSISVKSLKELVKQKVGNDFYIYFHLHDILETSMKFEIKYSLRIKYEDSRGGLEFQLKRMEIRLIDGEVVL